MRSITLSFQHQLFAVAAVVLLSFMLAAAAYAVPFSSQVFIEEGTITIDNDFSDWPEEALVVDETEEVDVEHDYYCYSFESEEWSLIEGEELEPEDAVEECEGGFVYSDSGQIDLQTVYYGMNYSDMFLGFDAAWPMMGAWDVENERFVDVWEFVPTYGIESLPMAFDHEFEFAFGEVGEEMFSNYIVAHIYLPEDLTTVFDENGPVGDFSDVTLKVYAESGASNGYDSEDEELGELATDHGDEFEDCEGEEECEGECPEGEGECEGEEGGEDDRNLSTAFEVQQTLEGSEGSPGLFELTGMSLDEDYTYRVATYSEVGDVTETVVVSTSLSLDAPEDLTVTSRKMKKATLGWGEVDGASEYRVQVRTPKNRKVKTFKGVEGTTRLFGKKLAKASRAYKFRVRACASSDVTTCGDWSTYKKFRTKPGKPLNLTATATSDGSAELNWDAAPGKKINKYLVRVFYNGTKVDQVVVSDGTSTTVTGLTPGYDYTFKVRAVYNKKNRSKFVSETFSVPTE